MITADLQADRVGSSLSPITCNIAVPYRAVPITPIVPYLTSPHTLPHIQTHTHMHTYTIHAYAYVIENLPTLVVLKQITTCIYIYIHTQNHTNTFNSKEIVPVLFNEIKRIVFNVHRTMYYVHYSLFILQCTLYNIHCIIYTVHIYGVHSIFSILNKQ